MRRWAPKCPSHASRVTQSIDDTNPISDHPIRGDEQLPEGCRYTVMRRSGFLKTTAGFGASGNLNNLHRAPHHPPKVPSASDGQYHDRVF
ncbi:hypothetical protein MRX96_023017 [Rhipicephalus microplus]